MSVEDPFFSVRDDVLTAIRNAQSLYDRHVELSRESPTTTRQEREWICTELRNSLRSIDWDLEDLEQTIGIIEKNPKRWRLDPEELAQRRNFIANSRQKAKTQQAMLFVRDNMAQTDSRFRERSLFANSPKESPLISKANQHYRYSKLENEPDGLAGADGRFATETYERQHLILEDDFPADSRAHIHSNGTRANTTSNAFSRSDTELEENSVMLTVITNDMPGSSTHGGLSGKITKLKHIASERRSWYLAALVIFIAIIVLILFLTL